MKGAVLPLNIHMYMAHRMKYLDRNLSTPEDLTDGENFNIVTLSI
jgi:hypothetical protein